jgi:hypothetical protein
VVYAAGLTHATADAAPPVPPREAITAQAEPTAESPLLTLALLAGTSAGVGAYRLVRRPMQRRRAGVMPPSVFPEPVRVQR